MLIGLELSLELYPTNTKFHIDHMLYHVLLILFTLEEFERKYKMADPYVQVQHEA